MLQLVELWSVQGGYLSLHLQCNTSTCERQDKAHKALTSLIICTGAFFLVVVVVWVAAALF